MVEKLEGLTAALLRAAFPFYAVVWLNAATFLKLCSEKWTTRYSILEFFQTHLKTLALYLHVSSWKLVSSPASMTHLLTHLSPSHIPWMRKSEFEFTSFLVTEISLTSYLHSVVYGKML